MLTLGPMSGYDLKQRIEMSIGNFWNESYGQIYPTLKRLQDEGWATSTEEGKAGRLVYSITETGRERLREWLVVAPQPRVARNEMLLKLFFWRIAPVETMRAHLLETRVRYAADLDRYEKTSKPVVNERQRGKPGLPFYLSVLSYGIHEARMIVAWCDETLAVLDGLEHGIEEGQLEEAVQ